MDKENRTGMIMPVICVIMHVYSKEIHVKHVKFPVKNHLVKRIC